MQTPVNQTYCLKPRFRLIFANNFRQYQIFLWLLKTFPMENRFVDKLEGYGFLAPDESAALRAATAHPRKLAARRDLIREGDKPGPVFVVLDGWACRYKILPNGSRQVLAFLMPGDCCDLHIGLLEEMDHGIQTVTSALVATIGREEMDAMMERYPRIARSMYIAQLVDEGTMRAWITSMGRRTSVECVAHLMCELYIRGFNIGLTNDHSPAWPSPARSGWPAPGPGAAC